MPTQLYLYNDDTAGYALDATGTGVNFSQLYSAGLRTLQVAAVARDNPAAIAVFADDASTFARSTDGGVTWTIITTAPWPAGGLITDMVMYATGDIHMFQTASNIFYAGSQGVWHSVDNGTSWTHILTMPNVSQGGRGGGIAAGASKLWYAESNTPLVSGSLPADRATYDIKTCNWDGSGINLVGSLNFDRPGSTAAARRVKLRASDDTFCLVAPADWAVSGSNQLYRIGSSGTITDISLASDAIVWEVAIVNATTFLVAATSTTAPVNAVRVWRTTNTGVSWSLMQTIAALEGFGTRGNQGRVLVDVVQGSTTEAYMYGYANFDTQPYVWKTADAGVTWTSFRNAAALTDTSGDYREFGVGGVLAVPVVLPLVAIPSRLATIVG